MDRRLRPMLAVSVATLMLGCSPTHESGEGRDGTPAVSYTHLTLPTTLQV